jgi:hypothetical protein
MLAARRSAWENRGMLQRVLSPVLVGRQEELSRLEDALLSANRGDGRFVLLAGEAGIGKTRLATELTRRARKLGCGVLWGSCSEAELSLPYLPFVEAIGNHLSEHDPAVLRADLGQTAAELAQLFPQLAEGLRPHRRAIPRRRSCASSSPPSPSSSCGLASVLCCSFSTTSTGPTAPRVSCSTTLPGGFCGVA